MMKAHPVVRLIAFALLLLVIPAALSSPSSAQIGIGVSVRIGPPALPVYEQPLCPGPGYLWTPGYWAWSDDGGYYWVPGTWVVAPVGLLWTPGYWGWNDGVYAFNEGYWGPEIGFYGGINYGYGYGGEGFYGGEWRGGAFFYNTAVMRVDETRITNVYVNRTVIVNNESHVAFNGGQGGVERRPNAREEAYARQPHTRPVAAQVQHVREASHNRQLFASVNHGAPAVAATAKPGVFKGNGVVRAKAAGAPYRAPAMSPKAARASAPAKTLAKNRSTANGAKSNAPSARSREKSPASAKARPAGEAKAKAPARETKARPASEPKAKTPAREAKARPASQPKAKAPAREAKAPASAPRAKAPAHAANARPASEPKAKAPARQAEAKAPASEPRAKAPAHTAPARPAGEQHAQNTPRPAPKASAPKQSAPKPSQSAPKEQKPSAPPKQEHKGK